MPNDILVFRGIPFARAARFRPPELFPLKGMPSPNGPFGPPAPQIPDKLDYIWGEVLRARFRGLPDSEYLDARGGRCPSARDGLYPWRRLRHWFRPLDRI